MYACVTCICAYLPSVMLRPIYTQRLGMEQVTACAANLVRTNVKAHYAERKLFLATNRLYTR
jgi:hypothetical protein